MSITSANLISKETAYTELNNQVISISEDNIQYWYCTGHSTTPAGTFLKPRSYTTYLCNSHSSSSCEDNDSDVREGWTHINVCNNHSFICDSNSNGYESKDSTTAIPVTFPNDVSIAALIVASDLNTLRQNLIYTQNRKLKYLSIRYRDNDTSKPITNASIYSDQSIDNSGPNKSGYILASLLSKLNSAILELSKKTIDYYPMTGTTVTSGSKIEANQFNTIKADALKLLHDCVCYSDCADFGVCFCYGNCAHSTQLTGGYWYYPSLGSIAAYDASSKSWKWSGTGSCTNNFTVTPEGDHFHGYMDGWTPNADSWACWGDSENLKSTTIYLTGWGSATIYWRNDLPEQ